MEIEPRLGDLEFHISRFNIHRKLNDLERLFRHRQREKENIEAPAPEKKSLPTKAANEDYGSFPVPLGVKRPTLPEPPLILTPRLSIPISEPRVVDLISPEQKEIKPAPWLPEETKILADMLKSRKYKIQGRVDFEKMAENMKSLGYSRSPQEFEVKLRHDFMAFKGFTEKRLRRYEELVAAEGTRAYAY